MAVVMTCMFTVPHKNQWYGGSAAQTVDGKIRVRAPGFRSSVFS